MNILRRILIASGVALALVAIPTLPAQAYWPGGYGPGVGGWRRAYVYDPAYRWGGAATRSYIRDLYLYGPAYANWHQNRRYRHWWW